MTGRHGHLPRAVLAAADLAAAAAACGAAYLARIRFEVLPLVGRQDVLPSRYLEALPIAITVMVAASALSGGWRREMFLRTPRIADALRCGGLALVMLSTAALLYWRTFQYSRLTIALAAAFFVPFLLLARAGARRLLARAIDRPGYRSPAAVVGGGAPAAALARLFDENPWLAVDVVTLLPVGETPAAFRGARRADDAAEIAAAAEAGLVREIYVALPAQESARLGALLRDLAQAPADLRVVPDLGDAQLLNPSAAVVSGVALLSLRERPLYGLRAAAKRAVDVVLSLALGALLSPVLVLLAIAVRLTSRGPALYRQERMGLDGRPFALLKFRTMREDAEDATGPVLATPGDARVTPLGRVLRRLSLDELPQLWNVLRGDMSLVGPRPERAPFIAQFRARLPGYMLRHSVKAGMTGWAQVHGLRGESSFEERLRYDLEYIDRWSLLFDLEILGRTAVQVVVGKNAY